MDLANGILSYITLLKECQEVLPEKEYRLITKLILESKLKYCYLSFNFSLFTLFNGEPINQLYLYDVVDKQIFIRLHIFSFISSHLTYKFLVSQIIQKEFPDTPCGQIITIYGCEYKTENNIKIMEEEELKDPEIIKKFPWELEEGKYYFYKLDHKYEI